jgi:NADH-quinone oxidoreductase subunit J
MIDNSVFYTINSLNQVIFLLVALVTLGAALAVVTVRSLVHSALWLVLALFGVGVLYVLLDAGFFAVAQVLIYIGAIAILFIFAVMLTRRIMQDTGPQANPNWPIAAIIAVVFFAGLAFVLSQFPFFNVGPSELLSEETKLAELGAALVDPNRFLLPFELASVLLVAAMIGAIYTAWVKK